MSHKYAKLGETVYFWFASNAITGGGDDGETPLADVRLAGAAADAAPVLSPTPTLLSHASYPAGAYEIAVAATTANGFVVGNEYAVFCSLTVSSVNPTGLVGSFALRSVPTATKLVETTIATVSDQTTFTLTAGPDFDNALTDALVIFEDVTNGVYPSVRRCTAYTGATKTVVLEESPDFTIAAGDVVKVEASIMGSVTTSSDNATAVAAAILDTPANLLVTDASGQVTTGAIADDAFDAAGIKADAVTKIAAGVATALNGVQVFGSFKRSATTDYYLCQPCLNGQQLSQASVSGLVMTARLEDDTAIFTEGVATAFAKYAWVCKETTTRLTVGQVVEVEVTFTYDGTEYTLTFHCGRNA